ncbi:thiosulfate/3-mercaptopyruvate sulfurtransferase [Psychromicrobium silvestre]|uniref:Thiosulfate/3-mercaptopyruvate sulfurtransferase n=1 Tax=Psychromicrobium silvestre TaxID=1645614 RepID=A0A7Y9S5B7_9MICC|nr:sulfurtransferase [Psychromicrobium silvestre]NYE94834.1 thiosulfate/3-mercaptopyruvate sulfurtransferase [Psychromicrobium silvestre]
MTNTVIDPQSLAARLQTGQRTVLLDVRWALGDPHGHEHYLEGHLPGALYVDLDAELAGHGIPQDGRHPLPSEQDFQAAARRWGISAGDLVVAYDDSGNMASARLWWLLRHAGFPSVSLLDGGLAGWREAGLPLESGSVSAVAGEIGIVFGSMPVISLPEAGDWSEHGVLLDARADERYRGEVEPVDPRAGHIPGAVSAPTSENLAADKKFLSVSELAARFAALGVSGDTEVAVYCGSGVTAAHQVAALEIAGVRAALFPGSFSAWSQHPELPVEVS